MKPITELIINNYGINLKKKCDFSFRVIVNAVIINFVIKIEEVKWKLLE